MKILRASFENFRLLKQLELEFSTDSKKKLTVIRAANESGKTTILTALQWALYGDAALPGKGEGFRLHPIDWDAKTQGKRVPIVATVEFEVTNVRQTRDGIRETKKNYRLVRTAFEEVDSSAKRGASSVQLFELTPSGAKPFDAADSLIHDELPPDLREVFFTDGDRALSFIEADVALTTKRKRVENAIRALLGLGVIEDAIKHVEASAADVNRQAKQLGANANLAKIASQLEEIENESEKSQNALEDARQQFTKFDELVTETDKQVASALQKGDKEDLQKKIESAKREIKTIDDQLVQAGKEHSNLFRSAKLANDLLKDLLGKAYQKLDQLHDQGKIPNTTIPVLVDRLQAGICICGENLQENDEDGKRRRGHIQKVIDASQQADEIQKIMTNLYYGAKPNALRSPENADWLADYESIIKRREGLEQLRETNGMNLASLELKVDQLPDTNLQGLRETRRSYNEQRDRALRKQATIETQLQSLKKDKETLTTQRDKLLREQKKGLRILSELDVINDVCKVLQQSYDRITKEELGKVSTLMNTIFLEMIGADPEMGAIIRRAEITAAYDIVVYGPQERLLNPDRDLNGASRRALTLAFVLALTRVSEVEAPNVIDTPLGMTSGYVKRSILKTAMRESSQLILFLTHDEITGCEDILDDAAGVIYTLTNPAHYPKMLVNDPNVIERMVLRCGCNHRGACKLCQRRTDAQIALELVS